jgi:type IV pilus assembly protein PilM
MGSVAPPIGVDFGVASLKVLQIGSGDQPALIAAAQLETPAELKRDPYNRLNYQLEALPKLIHSAGMKGKRVIASIPAAQTLCKPLRLQKTEGVSLRTMVESALTMQLGCTPGQIVYRFDKVAELLSDGGGSKIEVICFATSRELVERIIKGCRSARLEPVGIHNHFNAIERAFAGRLGQNSEDGADLFLDIGAGSSKVVITHGSKIAFAKMIEVGGGHLDEALAKQLATDLAGAHAHRMTMGQLAGPPPVQPQTQAPPPEEGGGLAMLSAAMRREEGDGEAGAPEAAPRQAAVASPPQPAHPRVDLSEPLEILTDDIGMCMRYHQSVFPDKKITRAVFIGGECKHVGLCQHVARALRIPAQAGDPLAGLSRTGKERTVGVEVGQPQPGWTVALGLCFCPSDL